MQKNKGNVLDPVSETQSSLLAGGSCSKVNGPFKTFFNSQLVFSVPVLNALWIICRLQDPISISWCCSFSNQHLLRYLTYFQFVFGPSIETWIILLRSAVLTESLNLARISSAFMWLKHLEFQQRGETWLLIVCQNLITKPI